MSPLTKRVSLGLLFLLAASPMMYGQQFVLRPVSGNGQLLRTGFQSDPLVVELTNNGVPVPNIEIRWSVATFGTSISLTTYAIATDGAGRAQTVVNPALLQPTSSILPVTIRAEVANNASLATEFVVTYSNIDSTTGTPLVNGELQSPEESQIPLEGRAGTEGTIPIRVRVYATGFQSGGVPNVSMEIKPTNTSANAPQIKCKETNILTDTNGIAQCTPIFSGGLGDNTFDVTVGGGKLIVFGEKRFRVLVGPPARFDITTGNNQAVAPGQLFPNVFTAIAKDAAGNAVASEPVFWDVLPAGAATLSNVSSATDASGRASARATAGTLAGSHIVRIRNQAGTVTADFNFTVNLNVSGIEKTAGDNQEALINTAFAQPLVVTVRTPTSVAANVQVQFASTGATLNPAIVTTDANGRAQTIATAGPNAGNITVTATAAGQSTTFNLRSRPPGPTITSDSFYNAASGARGGVTPGGLLQINGSGIAPTLTGCALSSNIVSVFSYQLASVTVNIGGTPAPIYAVCNLGQGQQYVTVQVPTTVAIGSTSVIVTVNGVGATVQNVPVVASSPGLFETTMSDGRRRAVAIRSDGSYVSLENRARRGETIRVFASGLGVGQSAGGTSVGTNQVAPTGTSYSSPFQVIIGLNNEGVPGTVTATLSNTIVGVYEVAFTVPENSATGTDLPFVIAPVLNDLFVFSNGSLLPVQ